MAGDAPPAARTFRAGRWLAGALLAMLFSVLLLCAAIAALLGWTTRSDSGTAWLLARVPGLQIAAPKGRLLGDFEAQRLVVVLPGGTDSVTITDLAWRGLRVERGPGSLWLRIVIDELRAARVDVAIAPAAQATPMRPPADLRMPLELDVHSLRITELRIAALGEPPLRDVQAQVHLGADAGAQHRIDQLSLRWDKLQANANAVVATAAPMNLNVSMQASQISPAASAPAVPDWKAQATLSGPLAAPQLQATVRAQPSTTRAAQSLDARAVLRPFAAWPISEVQASTRALDLSAFSSAAPATALSGQAVAKSTSANDAAVIDIDLTNAKPGRWNEGLLPLRSAKLQLAGRPDAAVADIELRSLLAELGNEQSAAGRITGQGRWGRERWTLSGSLAGVQPAQLDARAPSMQLDGPVALAGAGFDAAPTRRVEVQADLTGALRERNTTRPVQLKFDASVQALRVELRDAQANAGAARAALSGLATRTATDAPWAVKAKGTLIDVDPAVWWPGRGDSPWRRAASRLNASGNADIVLPADLPQRTPAAWLAAVRGQANVALAPSVLVGVPLSGDAQLRSDGTHALPTFKLVAEGNSLRANGSLLLNGNGNGSGNGAADRWEVAIDGPALARLAPVFALVVPAGSDASLAGSLTAQATVTGRWPALTTQGTLDAKALRIGGMALQAAQGRWQIGSSASAPVTAQLAMTQLQLAVSGTLRPALETAQVQLEGTGRAHQLTLRAESRALPPEWTDALQPGSTGPAGPAEQARTVALLQAQGGLVDAPGAPLAGWRGSVQQLEVKRLSAAAPLLRTRDVAIDVRWAGAAPSATVQPGRADILGGALRWSRIAWQAAATPGGAAQIDAQAELEPLRVAPLLARAQPDFGWAGDLTVGGRLSVRSAPAFTADIVLERSAGDLSVTDELGTQSLGLSDLRLALNAENGVWSFTQALAGTNVGVGAGAVVARTSPQATWPAADTPIEGVVELRVANLGSWGTWVPPGWRLDGALRTSASIGGRFGAPQYTGEIEGTKLAVRNFVQGVNVSDGDVSIRLQGSTARIDRFTAKAGGGTVRLSGDASLGETPSAVLKLEADKFQLLGRVDRRIVATGQAQLQLDKTTLKLDGQFGVDEGLIDFTRSDAPSLASDVEVVRPASPGAPGSAAPAAAAAPNAAASAADKGAIGAKRDVQLDLRVALGEQLRVRGRGLDTGLRGELRITSPNGRLAVNGTVRAADGTYAAYGQKLSIDRGLITFSGAVDNPRLDIEATRPNIDVRAGVAVTGTALNPRIRLFSEPELSEIDKLSWLVMGRASDGLGRTDTALLQRAALALLAGEGTSPTDQLIRAIGLDDLSVRQSDGEVRDTVISLGKQISSRWYVGYERGLNATSGSWQLIYRIARRFTLRAQSGAENAVDLIWTWRWQ